KGVAPPKSVVKTVTESASRLTATARESSGARATPEPIVGTPGSRSGSAVESSAVVEVGSSLLHAASRMAPRKRVGFMVRALGARRAPVRKYANFNKDDVPVVAQIASRLRYSDRNATIGSTRVARRAGR